MRSHLEKKVAKVLNFFRGARKGVKLEAQAEQEIVGRL